MHVIEQRPRFDGACAGVSRQGLAWYISSEALQFGQIKECMGIYRWLPFPLLLELPGNPLMQIPSGR
jgi:hypothetical protein